MKKMYNEDHDCSKCILGYNPDPMCPFHCDCSCGARRYDYKFCDNCHECEKCCECNKGLL